MWILQSWLLGCIAHGIPRAVASNTRGRKIFWLAASLPSTALLAYQTTVLFQDVFDYPVTVNIQVSKTSKKALMQLSVNSIGTFDKINAFVKPLVTILPRFVSRTPKIFDKSSKSEKLAKVNGNKQKPSATMSLSVVLGLLIGLFQDF